jgi:hypothetical protein
VNEYLSNRSQSQPFSTSTGTLPGAIMPLPVNAQLEKEFWEHPPWDPPPQNEGAPVDPHIRWMLGAGSTKALMYALTVGGPLAAQLLSKWFGPDGGAVAAIISAISGDAVEGLNLCLTAWYDSGKPSGYRCGIRAEWWDLPGPPYIFPISMEFEDCFYDAKKRSKYDCWTTYTISWENLF